MIRLMRSQPSYVAIVALSLILTLLATPTFAAGGTVLAPTEEPRGYSLTDMAIATAAFNTSNHSGPQPNIPFRMLVTTSDNTFTVQPGTQFYVPLALADDSPPIIGDFPSDPSAATGYFFGASQLGGHDFAIEVDGQSTPIGPEYLVGPVTVAPLPDGGGTHYITLAVFLSSLSKGTHTVAISGQFTGQAVQAYFPEGITFRIPYTVIVQ